MARDDGRHGEGAGRGALRALGPRDAELARLVAAGLSDVEIADRLAVRVGVLRTELATLLARLGLRSRTELALLAEDDHRGGSEWPTPQP